MLKAAHDVCKKYKNDKTSNIYKLKNITKPLKVTTLKS